MKAWFGLVWFGLIGVVWCVVLAHDAQECMNVATTACKEAFDLRSSIGDIVKY